MKLFLFTWRTGYGEFFEIIRTTSEFHAKKIFFDKHEFTPKDIQELITEGTHDIIASGGGE